MNATSRFNTFIFHATACYLSWPPWKTVRLTTTAIALFNDAILRTAVENRLMVIELRLVCSQPEDYANPIEPSSTGAVKIAQAIVAAVTQSGDAIPGASTLGKAR